jgi:hypothetical protein
MQQQRSRSAFALRKQLTEILRAGGIPGVYHQLLKHMEPFEKLPTTDITKHHFCRNANTPAVQLESIVATQVLESTRQPAHSNSTSTSCKLLGCQHGHSHHGSSMARAKALFTVSAAGHSC